MIKGLEIQSIWGKVEETGYVQFGEDEIKEGHETVFKYWKGCQKPNGEKKIFLATEGRTQGNRFKCQQSTFRQNMRENLTVRNIGQWNKLPKQVVASPLEVFKKLDWYLWVVLKQHILARLGGQSGLARLSSWASAPALDPGLMQQLHFSVTRLAAERATQAL